MCLVIGHPHTLHMSQELSIEPAPLNTILTVLVEKSLKHRMCNLHVCRPIDPWHVFVVHAPA